MLPSPARFRSCVSFAGNSRARNPADPACATTCLAPAASTTSSPSSRDTSRARCAHADWPYTTTVSTLANAAQRYRGPGAFVFSYTSIATNTAMTTNSTAMNARCTRCPETLSRNGRDMGGIGQSIWKRRVVLAGPSSLRATGKGLPLPVASLLLPTSRARTNTVIVLTPKHEFPHFPAQFHPS